MQRRPRLRRWQRRSPASRSQKWWEWCRSSVRGAWFCAARGCADREVNSPEAWAAREHPAQRQEQAEPREARVRGEKASGEHYKESHVVAIRKLRGKEQRQKPGECTVGFGFTALPTHANRRHMWATRVLMPHAEKQEQRRRGKVIGPPLKPNSGA